MATEGRTEATGAGATWRRLRERAFVWRKLFVSNWNLFKASRIGVVGLAIMIAFVILAVAAPFMGLRDPIRWTAPDEDLISVESQWMKDSITPGSEFRNAPSVNQGIAFRVLPDSFDPRTDRIYVAMGNRLYAIVAEPAGFGRNAWQGSPRYFDVAADGVPRTITAPIVVMNYGDYVFAFPDDELYLGTGNDTGGGSLFILRDQSDLVPEGPFTHRIDVDGRVTGVAAFNADMVAPSAISGAAVQVFWNGTAWVEERAPGSADAGEYASLGLNASGGVFLGYFDYTSGQPRVAARQANTWTLMPAVESFSASDTVGTYTSLEVGTDGRPRLAYYDVTAGDLKFARWNGTGWGAQVVESIGDVGRHASLALDAANQPRIAYYNATSQALRFAAWNGTAWVRETVDATASVGQYASLALNASGEPRIAYYDATNGALKYAAKVGAVWTVETVDDGGDVGQYASLAIDPTGASAIAYFNATELDLKFARWNGTGWDVETLRSEGHVGLYTSLRYDGNGRPHIGYYTFASGRSARDLVVVGTEAGKVYGIDVSYPAEITRLAREKLVTRWDYRVRWVEDLGSEVHLAPGPRRGITNVPLFSPAFSRDGSIVVAGTADGYMWGLWTANGTSAWRDDGGLARPVFVGAPWGTAPVVADATEGPLQGREVVYAASNRIDYDDNREFESLLFARLIEDGQPIPEWRGLFTAWGDGVPVEPRIGTPDGGNLTQPTVDGRTIYVGSDSGRLYAFRRDAEGEGVPAGSLRWVYEDQVLRFQGIRLEFSSPPVVRRDLELLFLTANHDNATANPDDDHGVVYTFKLDGSISWKKTFLTRIPGMAAVWQAPRSIRPAVFIGFGGPAVTGVQSLSSTGSFLAPSLPSWAYEHDCPTPEDPGKTCPGYPSGNQYWLGLDSQGRDIFSQVIWGSRIALLVGFLAAFFTVLIGVVVGLVAGYIGGKTESVLMRFTDVILVLPGLPLIITLAAVIGPSIFNIILVISLLGWPGIARIIRSEVLSLKERPFIDSARVTGASTTRVVFRHLAPNVMPLAFLYMTFAVSGAILTEAALSFIGLGDINTMSWGIMLQLVSQSKALTAWWWLLPPGIAITLISLAFFLVGRAFDEIVNPRLRKR